MRKYILIACLAAGTAVFAQKRELRKIEKAVMTGDLATAQEIFNSINEQEVEEDYKGQYLFFKAASLAGVIEKKKPTYEEVVQAEKLIAESESLGFKDENMLPMVKQIVASRKIEIANDRLLAGDIKGGLKIIDAIYESDTSNKDMLMTSAQLSYQSEDFAGATSKFQELFDLGYTGQSTDYFATNISTGVEENFGNVNLRDVSVNSVRSHTNSRDEVSPSEIGSIVNNLVWLYKNDNQLDKAKFTFNKALDRFPDDVSLEMAKSEIYNNLGMMEEYEQAVEKLNSSEQDPKVYDNLGTAALKAKNYDKAIGYLSRSLDIEPSNYASEVNLSNAYIEKGNLETTTATDQEVFYKQAIKHLEQALAIKPEDPNVMNTLVSLYEVFQMTEKADALKAKM
jgi:tetratricopeptide (TPR) repeat protein